MWEFLIFVLDELAGLPLLLAVAALAALGAKPALCWRRALIAKADAQVALSQLEAAKAIDELEVLQERKDADKVA
jgi:hypothetical protein